jgi:Winged helix DNA-binding domain
MTVDGKMVAGDDPRRQTLSYEAAMWIIRLDSEGPSCHLEFCTWLLPHPGERVAAFFEACVTWKRLGGIDPMRKIDVDELCRMIAEEDQGVPPARGNPVGLSHLTGTSAVARLVRRATGIEIRLPVVSQMSGGDALNKKLALLRFMARGRGWYSAAELRRELNFPEGSISAYLKDLSQADLIVQKQDEDAKCLYHCILQFED